MRLFHILVASCSLVVQILALQETAGDRIPKETLVGNREQPLQTSRRALSTSSRASAGTRIKGSHSRNLLKTERWKVYDRPIARQKDCIPIKNRKKHLSRMMKHRGLVYCKPTKAPIARPTAPSPTPPLPTISPSIPTSSNPTPTPFSTCNSLSREEAFLEILTKVSSAEDLSDAGTPQGFAFNWLVNTDAIDPCTYPTVEQRYALVVIYNSTNGDDWKDSTGWLTAENECEWFGLNCDSDSLLIEFLERQNNLSGYLPAEIGVFTSLLALDVFNNLITGEIPNVLNKIPGLLFFDVESNFLTGPAFVDLSGLSDLKFYRVSSNRLTGSIPASIGEMTSLAELWMAKNSVTGTIPAEIMNLSSLDDLFIYENLLTGAIPLEIENLNLRKFQAQTNKLSSTIPEGLWKNTRLVELRLDSNSFSGTIPPDIGNLSSLFDLRLSSNKLKGTLPAETTRLSNLKFFLVDKNEFTGTIRDSFEPFSALEFADFSSNQLTGTLPSSIFDVPMIEILYFFENSISGSLPPNYANAQFLRDLYIYENQITGTVPSIQPGQLELFTEFRLENNDIVGIMPASICALRGDNDEVDLVTLSADCLGDPPQIECECCTACS